MAEVAGCSELGMALSRRVRELRLRAGMSQAELADVLGVGQPTVNKMETRGERGGANFNLTTLEALAWALEADLVVELRERV